jgi:hypothetical protein
MWQITNANTAVGLITIGLSSTKLTKNYIAHNIKRGQVMTNCQCDNLDDDLKAEGWTCYPCYESDGE